MNSIKITPLIDTLRLQKIDDEEYFSKQYSNYISNSRMGLIYDWETKKITPDKFFDGFKPMYSSSLDVGTAVHSMILQPEAFNIVDCVNKPTGKMGAIAEEIFKVCKGDIPSDKDLKTVVKKVDYYGGKLTDKRKQDILEKCENFWNTKKEYLQTHAQTDKIDLYLDQKSRETSYACIQALQNNKNIQKLLNPEPEFEGLQKPFSEYEQAILLDIKVEIPNTKPFIMKLKAKLDHYVINKDLNEIQVNDIKTLGKTVDRMNENIDKYHYNREFAFYSWLLSLVAKKYYEMDNPKVTGNYLIVSTIPQYYTKVLPMTKKMFKEGWKEVQFLLRLIAKEAIKQENFVEYI